MKLLILTATLLTAASAHAQKGTVRVDTVQMPSLGVKKQVVVYLPPSYARETGRRYPVAYYLHGLTGAQNNWTQQGMLHNTADSLIAAGMPEVIIVMPDGDDGWYTDWSRSTPRAQCEAAQRTEPAETYCVETARYATCIGRDVVAYIDRTYRTRADRDHRGIGGLSMGGYGAIKLALQFPDVFSAAASHSGLLTMMLKRGTPEGARPSYAQSIEDLRAAGSRYQSEFEKVWGTDITNWRANDPPILATRLAATSRSQMPAIYIDTGTEDSLTPTSRALHWELQNLRIPHEYNEYPGAHTWAYWRTHVAQSLAWMVGLIGK